MSQEEERRARGMVLLECAETKKRVALLQNEARRIGEELSRLGVALCGHPEGVSFDGETMDIRFSREDFRTDILDAAKIRALAKDIRKAVVEKDRLEQKVRELGLQV